MTVPRIDSWTGSASDLRSGNAFAASTLRAVSTCAARIPVDVDAGASSRHPSLLSQTPRAGMSGDLEKKKNCCVNSYIMVFSGVDGERDYRARAV